MRMRVLWWAQGCWALKHTIQGNASEQWIRSWLRGPLTLPAQSPSQQPTPPPPRTDEAEAAPTQAAAESREVANNAGESTAAAVVAPRLAPCIVTRAQFVQRLGKWKWLLDQFETLGSQNTGFDARCLPRVLSAMFEELIRVHGSVTADCSRPQAREGRHTRAVPLLPCLYCPASAALPLSPCLCCPASAALLTLLRPPYYARSIAPRASTRRRDGVMSL